jgi:hypothetical protein
MRANRERPPPSLLTGWPLTAADLAWAATPADIARPALEGWHGWGEATRHERAARRAVHFYKYDYKWRMLVLHPDRLVRFGCPVAIEPNFSTHAGLARAAVLYDVYRKRRCAACWGEAGVKLLVDLSVEPEFQSLNFLGVPCGWPSYATRRHADTPWSQVIDEWSLAADHCGRDPLFVVFGGGRRTHRLCDRHGFRWVPASRQVRALRAAE